MTMSDTPPSSPHQPPETVQSHPTPTRTPTPTPTRTPTLHEDQNPQTLENPNQNQQNQQNPQLTLDQQHQQQQQYEEDSLNQGMASSFPDLPSSIDLPAPITDTHVTNHGGGGITTRAVPRPTLRRLPSKRKKGKPNIKKLQAIEKKLHALVGQLNPIPFTPSKILDFPKHETLLKRLGLWDFVHVDFDRSIRVDLIAQLVATYDSKLRCSYVNEHRIAVNRADLARAFKLPVKKEKGGGTVVEGVELDSGDGLMEEDSVGFIEDFISHWVLLHEDTWMMPNEVLNWMRVIKEGHPEKVDWAGLFWFMVEKELTQGEHLQDCYYASHLQYLIKSQREDVLLRGEPEKVDLDAEEDKAEEVLLRGEPEKVDLDAEEDKEEDVLLKGEAEKVDLDAEEIKEEEVLLRGQPEKVDVDAEEDKEEEDGGVNNVDAKVGGANECQGEEGVVFEGPSIELTLGQDGGEKEEEEGIVEEGGNRDAEMMDVDEGNEEVEEDEEKGQWLLDGKDNFAGHFLQRCSNMNESRELDNYEGMKVEDEEMEREQEDEEVPEDRFDIVPNHDDSLEGEGLTGNLLQALETTTTQMVFNTEEDLGGDQSPIELLASRSVMQHENSAGPSFYDNSGKKEIHHEHEHNHSMLHHHSQNGSNKRLRIDGPWETSDFGTCMEQMQQLVTRARMLYEEKEQSEEQSNMNQQILLNELQKRDSMIEHLHKTNCEEIQKREEHIYRLERELYVMGNLVEGYRKATNETEKAFAEYRQRCQLPEESIYKDAGPGGLMLSTAEIERQRLKQEEEYRLNCLMLEQKAKEAEEEYIIQFEATILEKFHMLENRLEGLGSETKQLQDLWRSRKNTEAEEQVPEKQASPEAELQLQVSEKQELPEDEIQPQVSEMQECPDAEPQPQVSEMQEDSPTNE